MDHLRLSHADDEIIIVVEAAAEEPVAMPQGDRQSVVAYNKSDAQGGVSLHRPTFLIQDTQRVLVKTWGEGLNARVLGAALRQESSGMTLDVPAAGGAFDLVPGYWTVSSLRGQWKSWSNGHWVAGGIFASVTYQ